MSAILARPVDQLDIHRVRNTGEEIAISIHINGRASEDLASVRGRLDIIPFGRQEERQDAPEGVPQERTGSWVRRHDEYTPHEPAGGRS